jgi:hypothetical protein
MVEARDPVDGVQDREADIRHTGSSFPGLQCLPTRL